ncbi:glycosyl transferase family 1 [Jatrophihabitans sp. GAS493]|nr:glycosyl transferase family 1 [Jatrophihabitans sp. GAS493]
MRPVEPVPALRGGQERLAVYLGIMGPQDGVDQALRALAELVHGRGRQDCHLALLGFGDCLEELKELAVELNLDEYVTFTGRVAAPEIADYLSTADIGICPDPKSPLNDVSTMNKTMEYMAYCLPVISFDLVETRVSAGESAIYLPSGDLAGFAQAWELLLDDPGERAGGAPRPHPRRRRARLGSAARQVCAGLAAGARPARGRVSGQPRGSGCPERQDLRRSRPTLYSVGRSGAVGRFHPASGLTVAINQEVAVSDTTCHMSISLDGFVAGPDQSRENPWASGGRSCTAGTSATPGPMRLTSSPRGGSCAPAVRM